MLNIVNMWHKLKSYNFSLTGGLIQTNTKKVFRDIHLQYMLHKSTVLSLIVNCRLIHCRLNTCSRDKSILFFIKICLWYFSQRLFGLKTSAAATILSSWIQKSAICACAYLNAPRPYKLIVF